MPIVHPKSSVHTPFDEAIKAWVEEKILYGMDGRRTTLRECQIIGLSSYKDSALAAEILVKEGESFSTAWSDVPLHMLFHKAVKPKANEFLDLEDVIYHNSLDEYIELTYYPSLAKGECQCYFPRKDRWLGGEYLGTVDWYKGNHNAHLVALENGQFAMVPHHKIQFNNGSRTLPPYKKQRMEWRV